MAQRRMVDRDIILSSRFLRMNNASHSLYLKLLVTADDDGFVDNVVLFVKRKSVLNELVEQGFVYRFDSGAVLLRHWNVHNRIRKDTYKPTILKEEKALVTLDNDNIYYLKDVTQQDQNGTVIVPQERVAKVRKGKVSEAEASEEQHSKEKQSEEKKSVAKAAGNAGVTADACGASLDKKSDFDIFWESYPRKEDRIGAKYQFEKAGAALEEIMKGLENHKKSNQWVSDNGMYIPTPAKWLLRESWKTPLVPYKQKTPRGATGELGEEEREMIRRALAQG